MRFFESTILRVCRLYHYVHLEDIYMCSESNIITGYTRKAEALGQLPNETKEQVLKRS